MKVEDSVRSKDEPRPFRIQKKPEPLIWLSRRKRPPLSAVPPAEQPRERLFQLGAASLTDVELLSVVLRETGSPNAEEAAAAFLEQLGGPRGLLSFRPNMDRARKLGDPEAATMVAVMELSRRLWWPVGGQGFISGLAKLAEKALAACGEVAGNCLGAFLFAPENRQIGYVEILRQEAPPREFDAGPLLREALRKRAVGISLFCVRSGGDPSVVEQDRLLAAFALASLRPLALELRDYLIISRDKTFEMVYGR